MNNDIEMDEDELDELYSWVDTFKLSRPKRNIARDFSDGILMAEIVKHRFPKIVELKLLIKTLNSEQKLGNWSTLNRKVFNRMGFNYLEKDVQDIVAMKPMAIEKALKILKVKMDLYAEALHNDKNLFQEYNDPPGTHLYQPKSQVPHQEQDAVDKLVAENSQKEAKDYTKRGAKVNNSINGSIAKKEKKQSSSSRTPKPKGKYMDVKDPYKELEKKDEFIGDLEDTIGILELKVNKLEQLVSLKEHKIELLENSLREMME